MNFLKKLMKILVISSIVISIFSPSIALGWWNENWHYRREIIINNTQNINTLEEYDILINLSVPKERIYYNFTDLRFTYYDPKNEIEVEIPYWIENDTINGTASDTIVYNGSIVTITEDIDNWYIPVWIKVKEIPVNGYAIVYAYYSNPTSRSFDTLSNNGTATFLHFEDWEECITTTNCSGWTFSGSGETRFQVINGSNSAWRSRSGNWFSRIGIVWDKETAIAIKQLQLVNKSQSFRFIGGLKLGYINSPALGSYCPSPYNQEYILYKIGVFNGSHAVYLNYYITQGILLTDFAPNYYFLIRNYMGNCFDTQDDSLAWNNTPFTIINRDILLDLISKGIPFTKFEIINLTIFAYGDSPNYFKWVGEDLNFITPLSYPEPTYTISYEEAYLSVNFSYPPQIFINGIFPLFLNISYNNSFLTNLTQSNFKLFLNNEEIEIINFTKYDEINYLIFAKANTSILGQNNLKILVTFNNLIGSASSPIFIKTPIKQKILFLTDHDWKNVYSLAPLKKPILITNKTDEKILHFINLYQPEQIFILGDVEENINHPKVYKISSYLDIPKLFFDGEKGVYAGNSEDRRNHIMLASQIAALLNKPLVFTAEDADNEYNFSSKTTDEIKEIYLQKLKEKNKNTNYLIVAEEGDLIAPIVSAQKTGFILDLPLQTIESSLVMKNINETAELLNKNGLFVNNSQYLFDGAFVLLGKNIPPIIKEDPVEKQKHLGIIGFNDPEDGNNFTTYLEYGDLNNDTYLDVAVGKLPDDEEIASLMLSRTLLQDNKKALIASEYLHTAWPVILLYAGGGMWQGHSIAKTLKDQGYNVTKFVEHRSDPVGFFSSLTDIAALQEFINQANKTSEKVEKLLGKKVANVINKIILILKALNYAEQVLEMYLEYDWSTFGPNWQKAWDAIKDINWSDLDIRKETIKFFVNLLWPYPWEDLSNKTSLQQQMQEKSLIYFVGVGNKSLWILPNQIKRDVDPFSLSEFLQNSYNGSNYFSPNDIPYLNTRLIWDNTNFGGVSEMKDSFLEKGAASLIGASALNYNQFSAEIDGRFFKKGWTIGSSLIDAINDFRDDWLTWDPLNILKPGIKAKTLREFILWGDPSLPKDPIIEPEKYFSNITCNNGICEQNVTIPIAYETINTTNETTVFVDTEDYLLELCKPIIPLVEFEYYLPFSTEGIITNVTFETVNFTNITLPKLELLQYGINTNGTNCTNETVLTWYPENISRINISTTVDGRTRTKLIHAAIMYNESSGDAVIFPKININLKYLTPLEFSIFPKNISLGETQQLEVKVWSNISDDATLYLQFSNSTTIENFAINYTLNVSSYTFYFNYTPKTIGAYSVKAVLVKHDPLTVGPRESTFYVSDTTPPKLLIHEYLNRSTCKPGDELKLKAEVIEDDVISGDCQIYVGRKFLGNISYSQGWCNGSVALVQDTEGEKVINVTISDRSGNIGYNDSYILILEIPKVKETPTGFITLAPITKRNETNITTTEKQAFPPVEEVKKEEKIKAVCGNGICEEGENQENCPIDCMPKIEKKEIPKQTGLTGFFVLVASNLPLILLAVAILATIILALKIKAF